MTPVVITKCMQDNLMLRMLGQNITLCRYQWMELLDELSDDSPLAKRIGRMLEGDTA